MTEPIKLPPLPETDWYAVWHGQALYGIYATLTEATDAAAKLNCKGSVSAFFTEQHLQEAQRAAIEADRQARGNADASTIGGEPVAYKAYVQKVPDHCDRVVWRDRYYHLPIEGATQQTSDEWKQAIDHELVSFGTTADSYSSPKEAINALIDWNVSLATDPKVNGGYKLVPLEPIEEMIESGWMVGDVGMEGIYKAMLEAAPSLDSPEMKEKP